MTAQPKPKMTADEFVAWALGSPAGRYELVLGEVVAMAPERARHNLGKAAVYKALDSAVKRAGLPCAVFTDGMSVRIDNSTVREPDAAVQCGTKVDLDDVFLHSPMIVVEVISPSTERDDTGSKLLEYFTIASIQHYLIIDPYRPALIHHARGEGGEIRTHIHTGGEIVLNPPGLKVNVAEVFASA